MDNEKIKSNEIVKIETNQFNEKQLIYYSKYLKLLENTETNPIYSHFSIKKESYIELIKKENILDEDLDRIFNLKMNKIQLEVVKNKFFSYNQFLLNMFTNNDKFINKIICIFLLSETSLAKEKDINADDQIKVEINNIIDEFIKEILDEGEVSNDYFSSNISALFYLLSLISIHFLLFNVYLPDTIDYKALIEYDKCFPINFDNSSVDICFSSNIDIVFNYYHEKFFPDICKLNPFFKFIKNFNLTEYRFVYVFNFFLNYNFENESNNIKELYKNHLEFVNKTYGNQSNTQDFLDLIRKELYEIMNIERFVNKILFSY